jgi:hypothetical protein
MSFSSLSNSEKLLAAQIALKNIETNVYRLVSEIGLDPDTFNMNTYSYDESEENEDLFDSQKKKNLVAELAKVATLKQKIEQLS